MTNLYQEISKLSPEKRKLLEKILNDQDIDLNKSRILPQDRGDKKQFPLSFSQQRMWFLDKLEPGNPMYNNPAAVKISGAVNMSAIQKSLDVIANRHEVLRTIFGEKDGQPFQIVESEHNITCQQIDLSDLSVLEKSEKLDKLLRDEALKPFNLTSGPLLRTMFIKLEQNDYVFLLIMHHIISDAWTLAIFIGEFVQLYNAFINDEKANLPVLSVQYVDYAVWQRNYLQAKVIKDQLVYWKKVLKNSDTILNLPSDYTRPSVQTFHGNVFTFTVHKSIKSDLEDLCKKNDVTLFMMMISALFILFYRYTREKDINIGTPIANRNRSEIESLMGVFVNTVVLRASLNGKQTFTDFLLKIKEIALNAYAHQDIPFEMIVEELNPRRNMSASPFFQTMFVMQNAPSLKLEFSHVTLTPFDLFTPTAKFDLTFVVDPGGKNLACQIVYNTDLFELQTINRMANHYTTLLESCLKNPNEIIDNIELITQEEKKFFAQLATPKQPLSGSKNIIDLFEEQVKKTPQSQIYCGHLSMCYSEFGDKVTRLANILHKHGVTTETIVGVYLQRDMELYISLFAIMKSGGVFLPLDIDYPHNRLSYIINDSKTQFIITHSTYSNLIATETSIRKIFVDHLEYESEKSLPTQEWCTIYPENSAYIIYTSGTTGHPKGVVITHESLSLHCQYMAEYFKLTKHDKVLQFASTNFDASLEQIFPTLISGAHLYIRNQHIWSPQELLQKIAENKLTVVNVPTAYWNQLSLYWVENYELVKTVRMLIIGGDVLKKESLFKLKSIPDYSLRIFNAYGPTETTITSTAFDVFPKNLDGLQQGGLPIGKPLSHRALLILDENGERVPIGVPGELYIGGTCLARGYLNRPDLTAEKFVPFDCANNKNQRMYRTGDKVRMNNDGQLEFFGRTDNQVKIRGFRIELGEIETTLRQHPDIRDIFVNAYEENDKEKILIAYYVSKQELSHTDFRDFLTRRLPDYMIPSHYIHMHEFPLTTTGKIDRQKCPLPDSIRPFIQAEYTAPRTDTEKRIAAIMSVVLNIDKVGIKDNFFDLGGHSMLGTQVIARVKDEFKIDLPLRIIFENPTIEGIVQAMTKQQAQLIESNELEKMLDELDGLSEDDIQKLLSEE